MQVPAAEFEEALTVFFLSPRPPRRLPKRLKQSGHRSLLHLLRRDLCVLYGPETYVGAGPKRRHRSPVLAALGMFVGIDMLSTFACPSSIRNDAGERFKWFAKRFAVHPHDWHVEFLWKLRSSLAHRYSMKVAKTGVFRFSTSLEQQDWITVEQGGYTINLWGLKDLFRAYIRRYEESLRDPNDVELRNRFLLRYRKSGTMKAPPISPA